MGKYRNPQAISYIRFSAIHQGSGSSVERQSELTQDWLRRHPEYELSKLSQKDLGRSGFKGTHLDHGLGRIISAIEDGKITSGDALLIEAVDRLGRLEPLVMVELITKIVRNGVDIYTLQDDQKYDQNKLNESSGSLFILVGKVQAAHDYSKQLSKRISASYEARRKKARQGEAIKVVRPEWLNTDNKLNERAEAVKASFQLYRKGVGAKTILNTLASKYPFLETVAPTTLNRWFQNPAIYGAWCNKKESDPIDGVFEPIITKQEFYSLQALIKSRALAPSKMTTYHLSGLVKCACGARFHTRRKAYKGDVILYCNCKNYLDKGYRACENKTTWPYEVLNHIYEMSGYWDVLTDHAMEHGDEKSSKSLVAIDTQLETIEDTINKAADAILSMGGSATLTKRLGELEAEKAELEAKKITLTNMNSLSDEMIELMSKTLDELADDEGAIRRVLMQRGFKLVVDMNSVEIPYITTKLKITLKRNLQKYRVYLLELSHPEYEVLNADEDEPPTIYPSDKWYQGFSRKHGVVAESDNYQELVKQLEERKHKLDAPQVAST